MTVFCHFHVIIYVKLHWSMPVFALLVPLAVVEGILGFLVLSVARFDVNSVPSQASTREIVDRLYGGSLVWLFPRTHWTVMMVCLGGVAMVAVLYTIDGILKMAVLHYAVLAMTVAVWLFMMLGELAVPIIVAWKVRRGIALVNDEEHQPVTEKQPQAPLKQVQVVAKQQVPPPPPQPQPLPPQPVQEPVTVEEEEEDDDEEGEDEDEDSDDEDQSREESILNISTLQYTHTDFAMLVNSTNGLDTFLWWSLMSDVVSNKNYLGMVMFYERFLSATGSRLNPPAGEPVWRDMYWDMCKEFIQSMYFDHPRDHLIWKEARDICLLWRLGGANDDTMVAKVDALAKIVVRKIYGQNTLTE